MARVIVLGDAERVAEVAESEGLALGVGDDVLRVLDHRHVVRAASGVLPTDGPKDRAYAKLGRKLTGTLHAALKKRRPQLTEVEVVEQLENPLFFANALVRSGEAHGCVAGAVYTTQSVVRAALQTLGMAPGISTVSSFFLMSFHNNKEAEVGHKQSLLFADCGVVIEPSPSQLVDIALSTASSCRTFFDTQPRIAFVSFSTKGSAQHHSIDKIQSAMTELENRLRRTGNPLQIMYDGELQVDAAVVPEVAAVKAPNSPLEGKANVLIFDNLASANSNYKTAQRLGGGTAIGPILQGLAHPINDLSRGCSSSDVLDAIAVTVLQATEKRD